MRAPSAGSASACCGPGCDVSTSPPPGARTRTPPTRRRSATGSAPSTDATRTSIHPPVDVGDFDPGLEKEPGHFLWVHRLVPYKHPELVAEAFRDLPYRLTMVGVGPLERSLRRNLPPNVELRGWVEREELARLYGRASGFIHVGEEDFGITMVEALAAGAPVVALDAGGARDIVRNGVDGVLIEDAEPARAPGRDPFGRRVGLGSGRAACARTRVRDRALSRADARLARRIVETGTRPRTPLGSRLAAMRIGIDARNDGTGVGRYTFSLIRELARIDSRERVRPLPAAAGGYADVRAARAELPRRRGRHPVVHPARAAAPPAPRRTRAARPRPLPERDGAAAHDDAVRRHGPRPQLPRRRTRSSAAALAGRRYVTPAARRATGWSSRRCVARGG